MSNHLKFCSCSQCRRGLRTRAGSDTVRIAVRKARRLAKRLTKQGRDEDIPPATAVPYTD